MEVGKNKLRIMPENIKIFNGNNEPCDMMVGQCCCGATHDIDWVLNKYKEYTRTLTNDNEKQKIHL